MTATITCFDWSKYAGEPEGIYWGTGGYAADKGQKIHQRDKHMGIRYDANKERLTVWGENLGGAGMICSHAINLRESKKRPGRFRAVLSLDAFRDILRKLQESESRHREAQIEGVNRIADRMSA